VVTVTPAFHHCFFFFFFFAISDVEPFPVTLVRHSRFANLSP